jgi:hypothetical protein
MVRWVTGFTSASTMTSTLASGVSRGIVCIASDAAIVVLDLVVLKDFSLAQQRSGCSAAFYW